ncbi:MAG: EamA family transporter [Balneolaceae bacterium]|nr:EamA family transporter [Balneolaceae bacterium]MCH8548510.1 EamA family transporter [Balneolaceae bacterium]
MTGNVQLKAALMVAGAAFLWGCIGIIVELLTEAGLSPLQIVSVRVVTAFVILLVWMLLFKRDLVPIKAKHLGYFLGTGILSICFFNWSYFTAIRETSLSVAVVLLYTGPAFVVIMSRYLFGERITRNKSLAIICTLMGVFLVSELVPGGGMITGYGLMAGIGAGFGYALYSIFSKYALQHYRPLTITFWTFAIASLFMVSVNGHTFINSDISFINSDILIASLLLGVLITVVPYLLYTEGLKRMEAGRASIIAIVEPVAAAMLGLWLFGDTLTVWQWTGVILILASVIIIYRKRDEET